jgi:hypothetical protein
MSSPNVRFAHAFKQGNDNYLFMQRLGSGSNNEAQLVKHVQTGEVVVRKVSSRRLTPEEASKPDNEITMRKYLSQAGPVEGSQPRLAQLISYSDIPVRTESPKLSRVSYWKFYNGGDLYSLTKFYRFKVPLTLVARYIHQIMDSLNYMHKAGVVHGDLNSGNIWLHWEDDQDEGNVMPDFYLGDFGQSFIAADQETDKSPPRNTSYSSSAMLLDPEVGWDVPSVIFHANKMISGYGWGRNYPWETVLRMLGPLGPVFQELRRLEEEVEMCQHEPVAAIPDLTNIVKMARDAEEALSKEELIDYTRLIERKTRCQSKATAGPLYHLTLTRALNTTWVFGPWFIATVNPITQQVISIHYTPHHRPNAADANSDSDPSGL